MKLTNKSKLLLSFFIEHMCITHAKQTRKINDIFIELYNEIRNAEMYLDTEKKTKGDPFYNMSYREIESTIQIPKPTTFPVDGFPAEIRTHIDEHILYEITYSIHLLGRSIKIHFLLEDNHPISKIHIYNDYVDTMLIWLIIINEYASKKCATELTIYLYFTSLQKFTPSSNISILGEHNVNTAFTMTCPKISEIVIFRKEEWFKVFLHETFHNFGLDFSDMNNEKCNKKILSTFQVRSEVNLYESYAEFWAKIMNALFCSYAGLSNKNNIQEFLTNADFFINFEKMYSCFQMVKVLDFMNLKYKQLYSTNENISTLRNTLYKENTNVLAYYVITSILLNDYQAFIEWCESNNISLLQFKKTTSNQDKYCNFILTKYKSATLLRNIKCAELLIQSIKYTKQKKLWKYPNETKYIIKNLRMSICELG